jgi:hypothetical protein
MKGSSGQLLRICDSTTTRKARDGPSDLSVVHMARRGSDERVNMPLGRCAADPELPLSLVLPHGGAVCFGILRQHWAKALVSTDLRPGIARPKRGSA